MKIISFTNNKGGVGKSTSAVSVAAYFALKGIKTLLVDLDPQGNASYNLIEKENFTRTMLDAFNDNNIKANITETNVENLYLIPANLTLDSANMLLINRYRKEDLLKELLKDVENEFELCVIDTSPALNVLTYNALVASNSVYIPVRAGGYELEGMRNLLNVIKTIDKTFDPGMFFTQYQSNQKITQIIKSEIEDEFGPMMESAIRQNVSLVETAVLKQPIFTYMPSSNGAVDYEALCKEIAKRENIKLPKIKRTRKTKKTEIEVEQELEGNKGE